MVVLDKKDLESLSGLDLFAELLKRTVACNRKLYEVAHNSGCPYDSLLSVSLQKLIDFQSQFLDDMRLHRVFSDDLNS